jgi:hypothetical protein
MPQPESPDTPAAPRHRALLGAATVMVAVVAGAAVWSSQPRVDAVPSTPSGSAVRLAAERGVDLTDRSPSEDTARLLAVVDRGEALLTSQLRIAGGIITEADTGALFTGYAFDRHTTGTPRTIYSVLEGRAEGPVIQLHADGRLHRAWTYVNGVLAGQIMERDAEGELVLRAIAGPRSERGGTLVGEITLNRGNGRESYPAGRFQWTSVGGSTAGVSESLRPDEVGSFMLFKLGMFGSESLLVADSNRITPDG